MHLTRYYALAILEERCPGRPSNNLTVYKHIRAAGNAGLNRHELGQLTGLGPTQLKNAIGALMQYRCVLSIDEMSPWETAWKLADNLSAPLNDLWNQGWRGKPRGAEVERNRANKERLLGTRDWIKTSGAVANPERLWAEVQRQLQRRFLECLAFNPYPDDAKDASKTFEWAKEQGFLRTSAVLATETREQ